VLLSAVRTEEAGEIFLDGLVIDLSGLEGHASLEEEPHARARPDRAPASAGGAR
jgi:hypothetical protein